MSQDTAKPPRARHLPRILLVDDEPLQLSILADLLAKEGFEVVAATRADEGWNYFQSGVEADLVISDVHTPGSMDGLDLVCRLAQAHPGVPVVLTSGSPLSTGHPPVAGFLLKPFSAISAIRLARTLVGP